MPVVVLAPELVGLILSAVAMLILVGLMLSYNVTIGWLLDRIASALSFSVGVKFIGHIDFSPLGNAIRGIDNTIRHGFGVAIQASQYGFNRVLHVTAVTLQAIGESVELIATDTLRAVTALRRHAIPALIAAGLGSLTAIVYADRAAVKWLRTHIPHPVVKILHTVTHTVVRVQHTASTVTHVVTHEVPRTIIRTVAAPTAAIHSLERRETALEKWVRSHARTLTEAGALGLVAAALTRAGLGWLKCGKVSRAGKALCGLDQSLLDALLAEGLVVVGTLSIVQLAEEMLAVQDTIVDGLRHGIRELRDIEVAA